MDTQVLIVGAGPVGLTLAIDLGKRGIRCTLIEKNDAPLGYPKMERCNPRTMEIFAASASPRPCAPPAIRRTGRWTPICCST